MTAARRGWYAWLRRGQRRRVSELPDLADDLYTAQRGECFHCLGVMAAAPFSPRRPDGWTREHVLPRSRGGGNLANIVLAHQDCNSRRRNRSLSLIDTIRARMIIAAIIARRGGWR